MLLSGCSLKTPPSTHFCTLLIFRQIFSSSATQKTVLRATSVLLFPPVSSTSSSPLTRRPLSGQRRAESWPGGAGGGCRWSPGSRDLEHYGRCEPWAPWPSSWRPPPRSDSSVDTPEEKVRHQLWLTLLLLPWLGCTRITLADVSKAASMPLFFAKLHASSNVTSRLCSKSHLLPKWQHKRFGVWKLEKNRCNASTGEIATLAAHRSEPAPRYSPRRAPPPSSSSWPSQRCPAGWCHRQWWRRGRCGSSSGWWCETSPALLCPTPVSDPHKHGQRN